MVIQTGNVFSHMLVANGAALRESLLACGFIPFLAYFMLTWKEHTHAATVKLFPEENRRGGSPNTGQNFSNDPEFSRGEFDSRSRSAQYCALQCSGSWVIPYFYVLGILSGFANLVPSFGFFLALLPPLAGGIGILSKTGILIVVLTIAATHSLMLNFLYPKLIGKRVRLNPLAVVIALLFWLWIWAGWG